MICGILIVQSACLAVSLYNLCPGPIILTVVYVYTVSQKNDTDVAHYNFNAYEPILVIFVRDIAE